MLPLRTIRPNRQADRDSRAERARTILAALQQSVKVSSGVRWSLWDDLHEAMRTAIDADPSILHGFQRHADIAPQICGGGGDVYLKRMREVLGQDAADFAMATYRETLCGDPPDLVTVDGTPITRSAMRHLYHLSYLMNFCRRYFGQPVDVVEVGAGYGNLARLMVQYSVARRAYLVDFPASSAVQAYYTTDFFRDEDVGAWDGQSFLAGGEGSRLLLCPPNAVERFAERPNADRPVLLLSTMAMTEITEEGQNYYLDSIRPDAVYIFGQTVTTALPNAIPTDQHGDLSNRALFRRLAEEFHPVDCRRGDYYSEFMGIRP